MRVLLCGLAVSLMLVASAAAGTGHLTMTVGGLSTYEPAPGETFTVDVVITADVAMSAWGMEPLDEADAGYTVAASVLGGYYMNMVLNYADDLPPPPIKNNQGWKVHMDFAKQWPGGNLNALNAGAANAFRPGTVSDSASSGWALRFDLTAPATEAGVVTRIVLEDCYAGDLDFDALEMTCDPLNLVPEPTSALLLLGALPLLLRRRR